MGVSHLVVRPAWRFVKCYFLQGAWREGRRGLVLSAVHAWSAFAKYALLWDMERRAAERLAFVDAKPERRVAPMRAPAIVFDVTPVERVASREPVASGT